MFIMDVPSLYLVACLCIIFCFFMLFRNEWVSKNFDNLIWYDIEKYYQTEDYDIILYKFWVWDFDKFIKKGKNEQ